MTMHSAQWEGLEFTQPDRLKKALDYADVSVGEMAEYLGVDRSTVSTWIHGRVKTNKRTLRLFALRTGVPLMWLETGQLPVAPGPEDGSRLRESNPRPIHYKVQPFSQGSRFFPGLRAA